MLATTISSMGSSLSDEHKSNKNTISWVGLADERDRRFATVLGIKGGVKSTRYRALPSEPR